MPTPPQPAWRLPAWVRRPALSVGLLAVAVGVSVAHGQPAPVARPSGVSVSVRDDAGVPPETGTLLLVSGGAAVRFDTSTRRAVRLPLPRGVVALRVWSVRGVDVVLARLPLPPADRLPVEDRPEERSPVAGAFGRTAAYVVAPGRPAVPLGPAETVVPSADGLTVWLGGDGVATRVALRPGQTRQQVRLPSSARLVADTPAGLVATTGTVQDGDQAPSPGPRKPGTPPPTGTRPDAVAVPGGTSPIAAPTGRATLTDAAASTGAATVAGTATPTDPDAVPLSTLLVRSHGLTRFLAEAEAVAAYRDVVLVRRADKRLGVVTLRGPERGLRWLPELTAVEVTGPGAIGWDGATFAVLARVNQRVRLMVGPVTARDESDINVVALEGGPPSDDAAPPAFTVSDRVLAARPDGRVAYYFAGERQGQLLAADVPPATAVAQH